MEVATTSRAGAFRRGLQGFAIALALPLAGAHATRLLLWLDAQSAAPILLGLLLGALAADGLTGLVHWACDTWGDERTRFVGPGLISAFREHHRDPRAMLRHDWRTVNREPGIAATLALLIISLPPLQTVLAGHLLAYGFLCSFIGYGAAANQLHFWAHKECPPRPVRWLQRCGLILSPARHARHHHAGGTIAYCISSGWLNPALDAIGFWRQLERVISRLSGARPRAKCGSERVE